MARNSSGTKTDIARLMPLNTRHIPFNNRNISTTSPCLASVGPDCTQAASQMVCEYLSQSRGL
jgi:hypothetical protein